MGRAKNTINPAEVTSTPIKVQYTATYPSNSLSDYGIKILSGANVPYNVDMAQDKKGLMTNYRFVRQLYYQYYATGSILGSASLWDPVWQSTAASGSLDETNYEFPLTSSAGFPSLANPNYQGIYFYYIPPNQFGEQISKNTLIISSSDSSYYIVDDGNGNVIDTMNSNVHVGNVFYAQGIVTVTNQDYMPANYLATEVYDVYQTEDNIDIILE